MSELAVQKVRPADRASRIAWPQIAGRHVPREDIRAFTAFTLSYVKNILSAYEITQTEAAWLMDCSQSKISKLLNSQYSLADARLLFAFVFHFPTHVEMYLRDFFHGHPLSLQSEDSVLSAAINEYYYRCYKIERPRAVHTIECTQCVAMLASKYGDTELWPDGWLDEASQFLDAALSRA